MKAVQPLFNGVDYLLPPLARVWFELIVDMQGKTKEVAHTAWMTTT